MSKKDLSRTIIEGGRQKGNKYERYQSNAGLRAKERAFSRKLIVNGDDENSFIPKRTKVYKGFTDKLNPLFAWVKKHCGQRWDDVYSKIKRDFDCRTIAGRHVVYDHLLSSVAKHPDDHDARFASYVVDYDGILREVDKEVRYPWRYGKEVDNGRRPSSEHLNEWLRDRLVREVGNQVFWMAPVDGRWLPCDNYKCWRKHSIEVTWVNQPVKYVAPGWQTPEEVAARMKQTVPARKETRMCRGAYGGYRQGTRLNRHDLEYYRSLHGEVKETIAYYTYPERKARKAAKK